MIEKIAEAIQRAEGWSDTSRSRRNNNPGNIKYFPYTALPFEQGGLGAIGKDEENFAIFRTYEDGFRAIKIMIEDAAMGRLASYRPEMKFRDFISKYAGNPNEGYYTILGEVFGLDEQIRMLIEKPFETFSQKDPRWAGVKIGEGATMGSHGCFIVSLAMIVGKMPNVVFQELKNAGCISADGKMFGEKAASLYDLEYEKTTEYTGEICIGETDNYKKNGVPQHFYVILDDKTRIDPLDIDPRPENDTYNTVSYRIFRREATETQEEDTTAEVSQETEKVVVKPVATAETSKEIKGYLKAIMASLFGVAVVQMGLTQYGLGNKEVIDMLAEMGASATIGIVLAIWALVQRK